MVDLDFAALQYLEGVPIRELQLMYPYTARQIKTRSKLIQEKLNAS